MNSRFYYELVEKIESLLEQTPMMGSEPKSAAEDLITWFYENQDELRKYFSDPV